MGAPRNCDLTWVDASNGHIPTGAIQGGFNEENEPIYIGRAHHEDSYAVGKINPEHGCCYIPFGGEEHGARPHRVPGAGHRQDEAQALTEQLKMSLMFLNIKH